MHLLLPLAAALLAGPAAEDLLYGPSEAEVRAFPGAQNIEVFLDAYTDPSAGCRGREGGSAPSTPDPPSMRGGCARWPSTPPGAGWPRKRS